MKTITCREDLSFLVHSFYTKIRENDLLGPVFNRHIAENEWPKHLEKLTDFWESNLFGVPKFVGNPTAKHSNVDSSMNYSISQKHFGTWLQLWLETIDEHFEGELAFRAKEMARKMATVQYLAIWHKRPENKKVK